MTLINHQLMLQLALRPGQQVTPEARQLALRNAPDAQPEEILAAAQQLARQQHYYDFGSSNNSGCDEDATWEYFEKGGWKQMDWKTSKLLNDMYNDENEECSVTYTSDSKYTWNFADLTQKSFWFDPAKNNWTCVKTRSIRCVQVLKAPVKPRG